MTDRKLSGRREQPADRASRVVGEVETIDREANKLANKIAREQRERVTRRKWAMETACLCADELSAAERIGLAKLIEAYVWEEAAA